MKLIVAVVQDRDVSKMIRTLLKEGHSATKLASTGGFLREGNTTLLIGAEDDKVQDVIELVKNTCKKRKQLVTQVPDLGKSIDALASHPIEVSIGGGTIFVLDVDQFHKV